MPVLRWIPEEDGPLAAERAWVQEGSWHQDLDRVRARGEEEQGLFLQRIQDLPEAGLQDQVVRGLLGDWRAAQDPVVGRLLKALPAPLARALPELLKEAPLEGLQAADRFLFDGSERDREAWSHEPLRQAVVALCELTGDPELDLERGPLRAWALRVASKAHLKEVVPHLLRAAGRSRGPKGESLPSDPYQPAATLAIQVIEENQARRSRRR